MMDPNDPWLMDLMEEGLPLDEPAEMLRMMPEIRQLLDPGSYDGELGLRSILERPDALSKAWRHSAHAERHPRTSQSARQNADLLRASAPST
jgi:hypothetical protein